ncbi:MAG: ATP-grasp domain-containing protein [Candidatus Omnitrophota bacterium]
MTGCRKKILIVGTTADYVELLDQRFPGEVLFITDPGERSRWSGPCPLPPNEVLSELHDSDAVLKALLKHLKQYEIGLSGVVSYDCESLTLASTIAREFSLPFSDPEAIANCRSKYLSKKIWREQGVSCPAAELMRSDSDVVHFFREMGGKAVLKPLSGSGGELVFFSETEEDALSSFRGIQERLKVHVNQRMYAEKGLCSGEEDPRKIVVMEEYIAGDEYSCDFILTEGKGNVLRLSKKIVSDNDFFGTILGYELPAKLPAPWTMEQVEACLTKAAESLGLRSVIAMADFKFLGEKMFFLEMTPRLGGDCLPPLVRASSGIDLLKVSLDFAQGRTIMLPEKEQWKRVVGMRLFAHRRGILNTLETSCICEDSRVIECHMNRKLGDAIKLPPEDYDLRILGHVIFEPQLERSLKEQCLELAKKVKVEII